MYSLNPSNDAPASPPRLSRPYMGIGNRLYNLYNIQLQRLKLYVAWDTHWVIRKV